MTLQDDINTQYWGQRGTFEPTLTGVDLQEKVNSLYWQYDTFYQGYKTTPQGGQLSLITPPDGYAITYDSGVSYGDLTTQYQSDVLAAGGTISNTALAAIDAFLYTEYDNGAGGTDSVSSFISTIPFLWLPSTNTFTGALVCVSGALTNMGFGPEDYELGVGLTGDGTSYLITDRPLSILDVADSSVVVAVSSSLDVDETLVGREGTGTPSNPSFSLGFTASETATTSFTDADGTIVSTSHPLNDTYNNTLTMRANAVNVRLFDDLDTLSDNAVKNNAITATEPLALFAQLSNSGVPSNHSTATVRGVAISNEGLPGVRRTVLTNAFNEYTETMEAFLTYGPLTQQYIDDVLAAGGSLTKAAKDAVESLLYDDYDNGEGGTGNVSSILPKIDFFWAPVSDDFSGALVCFAGSVTNFGFVSGDYSQSVGLTSSGTEYLLTSSLLTDIVSTDTYVGISTDIQPLGTSRLLLGRFGVSNELFDFRINSSNALQARYRDTTGVFVPNSVLHPVTAVTVSGVFAWNADSSNIRGYSDLIQRSSIPSSGLPLTVSTSRPLSLFGRLSSGGTILTGTAATIRSAVIGDALSDTERVVLTNALIQFDTDRSAL